MRQLTGLPGKFHAVVLFALAGGAALAWRHGLLAWNRGELTTFIFLVALGGLCSVSPQAERRLGGIRFTLGPAAIFVAQLVLGTRAALVAAGAAALADTLLNREGRSERDVGAAPMGYSALFHVGSAWIATTAAGLAFDWLLLQLSSLAPTFRYLLASLGWAAALIVPLTGLEALARWAGRDARFGEEWRQRLSTATPNVMAGLTAALACYLLATRFGALGALAFVGLLYLVVFAWRWYIERGLAVQQFESLLEGVRDGIAILRDHTIVYANDAFGQLVDRPRTEVLGTTYPVYLGANSIRWSDLQALSDAGIAELEMRRKDNSVVRVEVSVSPVLYQGRSGLQLVARDITNRYALQRQAAQSQRLQSLGQMAAGVAHDFNNSLMAIIGNVSVARALSARGDAGNLERIANRLDVAERAAMDAAATVRRLQVYSRPAPDTIEVVDLHDLAREVRLILRPLWHDSQVAQGKQIKIEVSGDAPLLVEASPAELREAITNLVTNGIDAMPEGGIIRLVTANDDDGAVLSVTDTGTGMSPETVEHIFEPFFTTKGNLGTGLGLFVTAGIVRHHGGRVDVESEVGKGTTFRLHFPLAAPAATRAQQELPEIRPGVRVLLVDDDPGVREATCGMLNTAGIEVTAVPDAAAALHQLDEEAYDLMITDLSMPGMSGKELARHARMLRPEMPMILISGWAQGRTESEGGASGYFHATLNKPITLPTLLGAVNSALPLPPPSRRGRARQSETTAGAV